MRPILWSYAAGITARGHEDDPSQQAFRLPGAAVASECMRSARARVVKGKIVTRARFAEGTRLVLVVDEPQPEIEVDDQDVIAIRRARASIRAGKTVSMNKLMAILDRL